MRLRHHHHIVRMTSLALLAVIALVGCDGSSPGETPDGEDAATADQVAEITLASPAFEHGQPIPTEFTEDGANLSPPLTWEDVPAGVRSFVLIMEDPDAPSPQNPAEEPWIHWVLYDIPASARSLDKGLSRDAVLTDLNGARQGMNSWPSDRLGYRGPAPPPGSGTHRYFFRLYALSAPLEEPAGMTRDMILRRIEPLVIGKGELMGVYSRP